MTPLMPAMAEMCLGEMDRLGAVRDVMDRVAGKWSMMILGMLESGPQRFTVLQKAIPGISQRMLTHTLRNLQRDGLISRESFAEIPPRVEYTLTPLGRTLLPAVLSIAQWAVDNFEQLQQNRDVYDEALDA